MDADYPEHLLTHEPAPPYGPSGRSGGGLRTRPWSAAAGVAATGAIILATGGWYWLDPAVALVIAVVVGYHAVALLRKILRRLRLRSVRAPRGVFQPMQNSLPSGSCMTT